MRFSRTWKKRQRIFKQIEIRNRRKNDVLPDKLNPVCKIWLKYSKVATPYYFEQIDLIMINCETQKWIININHHWWAIFFVLLKTKRKTKKRSKKFAKKKTKKWKKSKTNCHVLSVERIAWMSDCWARISSMPNSCTIDRRHCRNRMLDTIFEN